MAALAVVLFHAALFHNVGLSLAARLLDRTLWFRLYGVWLSFVISGSCIHYRGAISARSGSTTPPNFVAFWRRRFRRPYLVVVIFSVRVRYGFLVTRPETLWLRLPG